MADQFGGFGGLLKGLSSFMPQNDPNVKLMTAQAELADLQRQETELYAEIGKQALEREKGQYPALEGKLELVQRNLQEITQKIQRAQMEKDEQDATRKAEEADLTCPSCGNMNQEGVKFCQECGMKLGALYCRECGEKLSPGTRFCGECGAKQEG